MDCNVPFSVNTHSTVDTYFDCITTVHADRGSQKRNNYLVSDNKKPFTCRALPMEDQPLIVSSDPPSTGQKHSNQHTASGDFSGWLSSANATNSQYKTIANQSKRIKVHKRCCCWLLLRRNCGMDGGSTYTWWPAIAATVIIITNSNLINSVHECWIWAKWLVVAHGHWVDEIKWWLRRAGCVMFLSSSYPSKFLPV